MTRLVRRSPDGALAVAVVVAVFALQLPFRLHWVNLTDEGAILQDAVDILAGRKMYVDAIHPAFPGVFYLTAAAFAVAGASFETARTLACAIFALTAGVIYLIGRWWLRPLGALALVVLFVDYRVWAFPHWHMLSYSSLAIAYLLGATALVGAAFASGRAATYVVAGGMAALAMVTKQDSGVLGTAAIGLAILVAAPAPLARRVGVALWFGAGVALVFGGAVVAVARAGILPALVQHTIVAPLHGLRHFAYQGSPPLWPLVGQDATLRERAFSYFPSILLDPFWVAFVSSPVYRDTWLPDLAMRVAYHLPWLVPLAVAPLVLRPPGSTDPAAIVRRARERLVFGLAIACWLAFNPPHDWIHLLVLYPPALLLVSLAVARAAAGRRGRVVRVGTALVLAAMTAVSVRIAVGARRALSSPIVSTRGTVYSTAPQAASLQELVDALAAAAPPDVPLASMPYHPLLNFIAARPPLTPYYSIWPGEPDDGRTETVERHLDAHPDGLIVYNESQVPFFARMSEYAPELFAYLADHYRLEKPLGGRPLGFEFLLLRRRPTPLGHPLPADALARARVVVEPASGSPYPVTGDARARLFGEAVWPFERVLRVGTVPGATVVVHLPLDGAPTRVVTSYGVNPDTWWRLPPVALRFAIAVAAADGEHVVADATLEPFARIEDRRWFDVDVALDAFAEPRELVLRVASPPDVPAFAERAGFGTPRVMLRQNPT